MILVVMVVVKIQDHITEKEFISTDLLFNDDWTPIGMYLTYLLQNLLILHLENLCGLFL